MSVLKLYSAKGSGANIIEYLLELTGVAYEVEDIEWENLKKPEYSSVNPLSQVPSLVLPDGKIMTESLAIALYICQRSHFDLVPMENSQFLRWSVFLVASYYPTFTFGDNPTNWVSDEESSKELRVKTDEMRKKMIFQIEEAFSNGPWFLGNDISLIDVYLTFMFSWRPGEKWFKENCPKITRAAEELRMTPQYQKVAKRNSPT